MEIGENILPKQNIQPEVTAYSQGQPVQSGLPWPLPPASDIALKWQVGRTFPHVSCRSAVCPSPDWAGPGARGMQGHTWAPQQEEAVTL